MIGSTGAGKLFCFDQTAAELKEIPAELSNIDPNPPHPYPLPCGEREKGA
jgi:hypothetical protein